LDKENLTDQELQERFLFANGGELFNKMPGAPRELPQGVAPMEDFRNRIGCYRKFAIDLSVPRLMATFEINAPKANRGMFPGLVTLDHYLRAYRLEGGHQSQSQNKMRGMVKTLTNDIWGSEALDSIETEVMSITRVKYIDQLVKTNAVIKTRRRTGSIRVLVQRCKQTYICNRFRYVGREHKEVIYSKNPNKKMSDGSLKIPKDVLRVIKVTVFSHGYDGYMGLTNGHWSLIDTTTTIVAKELEKEMLERLLVEAQKGPTQTTEAQKGPAPTMEALLLFWNTHKSTRPIEVSVGSTKSLSSLSLSTVSGARGEWSSCLVLDSAHSILLLV
jgi:hypothetical protein